MELVITAKDIANQVIENQTQSGQTGEYSITSELYAQGIVAFVIDEIQRQLSLDEISFNQNFVVSSDVRKIRVEGTHAVEPIDVSKLNIIRL